MNTALILHLEGQLQLGPLGLPWWLSGKDSACQAGDVSSIPVLGRSPGEGNGNPSSILAWKTPWTGTWQGTVHGAGKSMTQLIE